MGFEREGLRGHLWMCQRFPRCFRVQGIPWGLQEFLVGLRWLKGIFGTSLKVSGGFQDRFQDVL